MTLFTCTILDLQKKLNIRYKRTDYGKVSIKDRGAKIWNGLPTKLKEIKSKNVFKKEMKQFAQQRYDSDLKKMRGMVRAVLSD